MKFNRERLIQVREKLGINKAEAARRLNLSPIGYCRYESGEREPSFQTVKYIAEVFNTSIDYLYGNSDCSKPSSVTISYEEYPELYKLVDTLINNPEMMSRMLNYAKKLN